MRPSTFGRPMWVFSDKAEDSWPTAKPFNSSSVAMQYFILSPLFCLHQDFGWLLFLVLRACLTCQEQESERYRVGCCRGAAGFPQSEREAARYRPTARI